MGRPKPLLPFGAETGLSLVLKACGDPRTEEIVLVLGADSEAVRAALPPQAGPPVKVVVNERHERGQTSSLKAGLETISGRGDGFAILPVDLPLATSADLGSLVDRFEPRPRGRTIFLPVHQGRRGHPALFAGHHRSAILELPDTEPLNAYVRVREGEVAEVRVDNPGVILPMNTPAEYRSALELWAARGAAGTPPA